MESTGFHEAADGIRLFWRSVRASPPCAVMVIAHGVGEHSGRYSGLAAALADAGVTTYAYDQRGHGRSGGARAHVGRWSDYSDDLQGMIGRARTLEPGIPTFVFGHSMGSMIALSLLIRRTGGSSPPVGGWVVSGVGLRPSGIAKPPLVVIARVLSRVAPRVRIDLGIRGEDLTHEADIALAYREDPLIQRRATVRWGAEALAAISAIKERIGCVRGVSLLILHGGADPLLHPDGARWLAANVAGDVELHVYPEALHEPHNEPRFAHAADDIAEWIGERVGDPLRATGRSA